MGTDPGVAAERTAATKNFEIPASGEVELRAGVQCRFRADVRSDDPADRLEVLDGEGRELRMTLKSADASFLHASVKRRADGFPVCTVSENAATLVLYQGDVELRRVPLDLQPSEMQVVTLP